MKFFKTIIYQLLFILVNSQNCFVNNDVVNSNNLFTYQGNVYDITNYNHPGGKETLQQTGGNALENYVNMPKYDFHLTSNKFTSDLNNLFVGVLKDTCVNRTSTNTKMVNNTYLISFNYTHLIINMIFSVYVLST